ncbi:hypothetical protein VF14_03215 [Nostoc linckia z18]|uniref:Uncharacterized protein n=4 Tax=Nostoc linckia TaxID=92942 RepID=A0A9Q6ENE3_NOSLI|nr:hypothetical protein VF02_00685 [Nostoc linckia z1]PHJ73311.1 hypothetical protein VF05_01700 [Nostoc linckia z3]PHJ78658.1 hypothetical protein VF03_00685 [Nostoc linckia z2]PHJ85762.1 hypothetical protein VF06_06005 [Nostoc linckia z4]PHJ92264.1 hypothetical protein VF07_01990 [Nostoc linckia z6]PHK01268.1 hypothetical protein VF04_00685 [Nostoc linckia z7]PHK07257.1 hypothetical protein VF08_01265 [Nostoc linckia z8]PHK12994.1 hypothetical protein VF09_01350 [Nostoc linckia z9]PHK2362
MQGFCVIKMLQIIEKCAKIKMWQTIRKALRKMIKLQNNEVKIVQVIVAQIDEDWVVAGLDADNKFYKLTEEEDLRLPQAKEVAIMARGAINVGRDELTVLISWVRDQISEILYPEM